MQAERCELAHINSRVKTLTVNTAILRPFAGILIYCRDLLKQTLHPLGLTQKSRNNIKVIRMFPDSVLKKPLRHLAATVSYPISVFADTYTSENVETVKLSTVSSNGNEPILICVVKDDFKKVKKQVEYHRNIGIRHFAYIDNKSSDGTFEWLREQDDVSLFSVSEVFSELRKLAWRKLVMEILGNDRWYLVLDSDEIFMYPGIEDKNISKYIDFLDKQNIEICLTLVVDMYTKGELLKAETDDHIKEYCYFDTDTYNIFSSYTCRYIYGGPRARVFRYSPQLATYRLIKMSHGKIAGTHCIYPNSMNAKAKGVTGFILHYKTFGAFELEKYKDYVKTGIHANNSGEYKNYLEKLKVNPGTTLFYDGSHRLNTSMDLAKINIIDRRFYERFLHE